MRIPDCLNNSYALEAVSRLVLQEVLVSVVDKAEAGRSSASVGGLEAEQHHVWAYKITSYVALVLLGDDFSQFLLGNVGQVRVDHVQNLSLDTLTICFLLRSLLVRNFLARMTTAI